jgi:hypothetical membrane protein
VTRPVHTSGAGVRLGALAWMLAAQFLVVQVIVAQQWPTRFSLADDVISALGNTSPCGRGSGGTLGVCSPWHDLMNVSFVVIGITMSVGALFTRSVFAPGLRRTTAIVLFLLGGVGVILVGLYPENESDLVHAAGAAANFLGANVALIVYGLAIPSASGRAGLKVFSVILGVVGLAATVLFVEGRYLGIGVGGMERVAIYPITLWQIVVGLSLWR